MDRKSIFLLVGICSGFMPLMSCTGDGSSRLEGTWEANISSPNVNGKEFLKLGGDSVITVIDSINYTAYSDKLEASVYATVFNTGKWYVRNDSIVASFEGAIVSLDTASFVLRTTDPSIPSVSITDAITRHEFCTAIGNELQEMFNGELAYTAALGKIVKPTQDSFTISNRKTEITYLRK